MRIGIIAKNQSEGKAVKALLSKDYQVHILTRHYHPAGEILDVIIETLEAKSNPHYDEVVEWSKPSLERCPNKKV